jgi:hypothetical protein
MNDYADEAIVERDPSYRLPPPQDEDTAPLAPMTLQEVELWRAMVARRPLLALLDE